MYCFAKQDSSATYLQSMARVVERNPAYDARFYFFICTRIVTMLKGNIVRNDPIAFPVEGLYFLGEKKSFYLRE